MTGWWVVDGLGVAVGRKGGFNVPAMYVGTQTATTPAVLPRVGSCRNGAVDLG